MKLFYEKADLEIKDLLIRDVTNEISALPPGFTEDDERTDDGSFDAG